MSYRWRQTWRDASLPDKGATIGFVALMVWGTALCVKIVYGALGAGPAVVGAILFPVLLIVTPWYALLVLGDPMPALLCYGALAGWALIVMPARVWRLYQDEGPSSES